MSYKYNNVVIKPGLYLGDQGGLNGDTGASSPIFSSMQLSLATNGLSRRDDNFFVLPGYKAILYKNTGINYITVYTIDNTTGTDIKGVWNDVYNSNVANQISKIDLFYNNVKIDYSNIKTMGFKASARLCWGAKLGEHSDGSYNKYALVLEGSTPRRGAADVNETNGLIGLNRPYLSLPWIQPIVTTNSSISFWWCSKGYENGVNNAGINYALSLYSATGVKSSIFNLNDGDNDHLQMFFESGNTGQLTFSLVNQSTTGHSHLSTKNICDGLWHHIVWNISGGSWTIYTDGVAETSVSKASYNMGAITTYSSTIGTRNVIHQDNQTNGYIADFRFYKNVLSPTEINGLLNGDHTYKTTLDVSSCLFQYTFDPDAVYTNNYTTYAIGAATVPYAAELRNGAEIMMPSMDLTGSLGKNIKIYPFTIGSNGFSISFWWRSDGLWATQGENSRLFYLGNGDETSNITFSLEIGSNGYPSISINAPLIWYRMEGNVTNSGSGSGFDGTLVGTASYDSTVFKRGSQSLLSNTSSYISIPTLSLNTYTNGLTIAFWFYRSGTGTETFLTFGNDTMKIISFGTGTQYSMYFEIAGYNIIYTFTTINTWNHFAITLTYSTNNTSTWKLYIDGILNSTYTNKPYPTTTYSTNSIGQITGYMDDFRIYQNVLSDAEILNVSNNTLSNTKDLTTLTDFCDDTWKHVVWTMTPESTWKLYVNNALINTYTGMAYPNVIQRSTNYIGSGYLTTDRYPCGFIGDFRMYNATLSSDNVTSLYNRTNTTDNEINLIQHYDFVEETMNANNNILYSNAPRYALELTNNTTTTGASGQYATTAAIATGTNGLTFSFWWKSKGDYSNQGGWSRIFDFGNGGGDERIVFAIKYGSDSYPAIEVKRSTNAALSVPLPALTGLCDERWKHVVWTMTNSTTQTSTWNIYINNVLRYTGPSGWYPNNITRTNHYIGRSYSLDGCPNGFIADFRVYNAVLTTQNITDLYNEVYTSETNLLLHTIYPTKTAPTLVNGAKIPITSSKTQIQPQGSANNNYTKPDNYYSLYVISSLNQYAFSSTLPNFINNTVGVSFSFWWKANSSTQTTFSRIFNFGANNSSINNSIYFRASSPPRLGFFGSSGNNQDRTITGVTGFNNGLWKHVVWTMTYSTGATSTWNIYINNVLVGTYTSSEEYPNNVTYDVAAIGTRYLNDAASSDYSANGYISDFRVYDIVLSQSNVTDLYNKVYVNNTNLLIQYPKNFSDTLFTLQSGAKIVREPPDIDNIYPSLYLATDPALNYHRGSYLSIPPLVKTGTNGLSFSIWWRAGATYANQGSFSRLFSFSNGKARDTIEFILNTSTLGYPTLQVHNGIKFGDNGITTMTSLCDGTWKHIVWTMTYCAPTQTASTWIVYVNGTATSVTATGTYPKDVSRKYAYIGQSAWIQNMYPTGDFADFRVYGAVLTQANVNSLFELSDTDKEDKLLLRQKFDSTESYLYQTCDNIKPSVLFENDPAITNTPTGQHVVLPALPGLLSTDVPDRRGISISFWWKSKGLSGISGMLFETGLKQDEDVLFLRTREGLNTYMSAQYYLGTGPADVNIQFSTADGDIENLENGEWHHIVWTMSFEGNSSNSYWKYYMDGYFIQTNYLANAYLQVNNTFATKQVNNFIGRSNWATINGCLNGYMSDFRIYNKCLTTQDVGDLYTNTYDDNSDLFLRYSFEKKIQIDSLEYTNIKAENDPSIIILLNGGATVVDNASDGPSNFSSYLKLSGTTIQWARPYLPKSFSLTSQTGLSFSFWFKPTGTSTTTARIFDFGNGQQNDNVLIWRNLASSMYPTFYVTSGTSSTNDFSVALSDWSTFFSTQNWKHVVWTLTYSSGLTSTWNAYLDKSRYGSADLTTVGRYPTDIVRTSNLIGKSNWPGDTGILFGNITDFRIYTTVLTQANVDAIWANTFTDKSNLFFSTDFKPKYNINLTPSHSTDTTQVARLYNGATLSTDTYKFGTSSLFLSNMTTTTNPDPTTGQGFTQYMSLIAPLPKLGTNGISFSFWWKSAGAQGTSPTLFDFGQGANKNQIIFWIGTSPSVQTRGPTGTQTGHVFSETNFLDTNWHHIVWNIDKYNNTWQLFYDNVSSGSLSNKVYPENVSRPYCFLGRNEFSGDGGANGYIDEFRIYSKVLTATDVDNLYNNIDTTSTSLTDNLIVYYSFNQDASRKVMDEQYLDNNVLDTPIFNT
jgi:hypothetical protein